MISRCAFLLFIYPTWCLLRFLHSGLMTLSVLGNNMPTTNVAPGSEPMSLDFFLLLDFGLFIFYYFVCSSISLTIFLKYFVQFFLLSAVEA